MSRNILCTACGLKPTDPRDTSRKLSGRAFAAYLCDFCGVRIEPNERCIALTFFRDEDDRDRTPHVSWESEFLAVEVAQ